MNPIFKSKDGTLIDLSNVVMINPLDLSGEYSFFDTIRNDTVLTWYLKFKFLSRSESDVAVELDEVKFHGDHWSDENREIIINGRVRARLEYNKFVDRWKEIKQEPYIIYSSRKNE